MSAHEIVLADISNSVKLVLHDKMSTTLTLNEESIAVSVLSEDGSTTSVDSKYYSVKTTELEDEDCTFEISFDDDFLAGLEKTDKLVIVYSATIDETGDPFEGGTADLHNEAYVTYGEGGKSGSTPTDSDTYSYGIEIFKYTEKESSTERIGKAVADPAGVVDAMQQKNLLWPVPLSSCKTTKDRLLTSLRKISVEKRFTCLKAGI